MPSVRWMIQLEKWKACLLMSMEVMQCFRFPDFFLLVYLKMMKIILVIHARILGMNPHQWKALVF